MIHDISKTNDPTVLVYRKINFTTFSSDEIMLTVKNTLIEIQLLFANRISLICCQIFIS